MGICWYPRREVTYLGLHALYKSEELGRIDEGFWSLRYLLLLRLLLLLLEQNVLMLLAFCHRSDPAEGVKDLDQNSVGTIFPATKCNTLVNRNITVVVLLCHLLLIYMYK